MKLLKKFESFSNNREEMCKYLCSVCGCSMQELNDKSEEELEEMCRTMGDGRHTHNENMNSMSHEMMCKYLMRCGYSKEELEMCSNEELMNMCKSHMEDKNLQEMSYESRMFREHQETQNYMFFSNLETIKRLVDEMLEMDEQSLDYMLSEHDWASDHISVAAENIEHVFNFVVNHDEPHHMNHDDDVHDNEEDEADSESGLEMPEEEIQRESLKRFNKFK
jgi:ATP-dependent helicase YprA (DUF1998 family)